MSSRRLGGKGGGCRINSGGGGRISGGNDGRISGGNDGGSSGGSRSFSGGGRRGGGNSGRSFCSSDGNNSQGGGRSLSGNGRNFGCNSSGSGSRGVGRLPSGSGSRVHGSHSGIGRRGGTIHLGGRAGGSPNNGAKRDGNIHVGGHANGNQNGGGGSGESRMFFSCSGGHVNGSHSGGGKGSSVQVGGPANGNHSGGGRKGGNVYVGGPASGRHSGGGRKGGSVNGRDYGRKGGINYEDMYDTSSEDYEEDDEFDDVSGNEDVGGNDDNEDEASGNDDVDREGGNETDTDDGDDIYYSRRGYSLGAYANVPEHPRPIRMVKKVIDNPTASRTLLALTRIYWPVGCIGTKDIDRLCPHWWRFIRKQFFKYYTYDNRYGTLEDARRAVSYHLHENIRKAQASERKRVQKLIKEKGGSFLDHRPPYLSEAVWEVFCKYWDSPEFKKKSDAAKENRKKQRSQHRSGATSYRRRAWDILEKTGKEPGEYHLFLKMHTDKNGICTSEAAGVLMERYIELCEKQNVDPNDAPIYTWAKAVGVKKNSIMGVPRTKASDIIPIERSRKRRRRYDDESGAPNHMADNFVIQTVDDTIAYARAHPDEFGLAPEQVRVLENSLSMAEGEVELPSDHPLSMETMTELVQVMVSVLTDIQARPKSDSNKGKDKGKSIVREEDCLSGSDDDDISYPPHSPPPDRRQSGIHIREG